MSNQRTLLHRGHIVNLGFETVELPNGRQINLEIVRHPGGTVIAAVGNHHQICLLRQYRHAAGEFIWEVPAGKLEPNESPLTTAQRELEEEAGLFADRWTELGTIYSTPGFCDERLHLYLAQNLTLTSRALQPDEYIEVHWLPFDTALDWAYTGQIQDAKTVVILFRAAAALGLLLPNKPTVSNQETCPPHHYGASEDPHQR